MAGLGKSAIHFLLAFCLLNIQLHFGVQSLKHSFPSTSAISLSFSKAWAENKISDIKNDKGESIRIEKHVTEGDEEIITENYISQATLWAGAIIAIHLLFGCAPNCGFDVTMNVMAAVAFMTAEVVSLFGYDQAIRELEDSITVTCNLNQAVREKNQAIKDGLDTKNKCTNGDGISKEEADAGMTQGAQYGALEAQKKSYEKIKQFAVYKIILQAVATIGWTVAGISALSQNQATISTALATDKTTRVASEASSKAAAATSSSTGVGAATAGLHEACGQKIAATASILDAQFPTEYSTPGVNAASECSVLTGKISAAINSSNAACAGPPMAWAFPIITAHVKAYGLAINSTCQNFNAKATGEGAKASIKPNGVSFNFTPWRSFPDQNSTQNLLSINSFEELLWSQEYFNYASRFQAKAVPRLSFDDLLSVIIPKVYAAKVMGGSGSFLSSFGTLMNVGGVVALLVTIMEVVTDQIAAYFAKPSGRAIFHFSLAGFAAVSTGLTWAIINQMDDNIRHIKYLLDKKEADSALLENSRSEGDPNMYDLGALFASVGGPQDLPYPDGTNPPCPTERDREGNCQGFPEISDENNMAFNGLPSGLASAYSKMANSILKNSNKLSSGSLGQAGNLYNAYNKGLNRRALEAKEKFKELTGGRVDMDKEVGNFQASLKRAVIKSLKNQGKTPASLASAFGKAMAPGSNAQEQKEQLEKITKSKKSQGEEAIVPEQNAFVLDMEKDKNQAGFNMADADQGLEQLDIKVDDIAGKDNGNIFDVISTRYLKTAYPRFFGFGDFF